MNEVFQNALYIEAFEAFDAFEGIFNEDEIAEKVDEDEIKKEAWDPGIPF